MVSKGPRPAHRKGESGRPYQRHRKVILARGLPCSICDEPVPRSLREIPKCEHPKHAHLPGCPTHPWAPSLDHPRPLSRGGALLDSDARAAHFGCNASRGNGTKRMRKTVLVTSEAW